MNTLSLLHCILLLFLEGTIDFSVSRDVCVCVCVCVNSPPIYPKLFHRAVEPASERSSKRTGNPALHFFCWTHRPRSAAARCSAHWRCSRPLGLLTSLSSLPCWPVASRLPYLLPSCFSLFWWSISSRFFFRKGACTIARFLEILPICKGLKRGNGGKGEVGQGWGTRELGSWRRRSTPRRQRARGRQHCAEDPRSLWW